MAWCKDRLVESSTSLRTKRDEECFVPESYQVPMIDFESNNISKTGKYWKNVNNLIVLNI